MESHPIPQNVTDFQFHLIGDMTLKQFGYLGGGLALAYLLFILVASKAPFVGWPLSAISALTGIAFAFLPINERPLDHWVKAYFKAIFSPTKRHWKLKNFSTSDLLFKERLLIYLSNKPTAPVLAENMPKVNSISQFAPTSQPIVAVANSANPMPSPSPMPPTPPTNIRPSAIDSKTFGISPQVAPRPAIQPQPQAPVVAAPPQPAAPPAISMNPNPEGSNNKPIPSAEELKKEVDYAKQAQVIQAKILDTQKKMSAIKAQAARPGENPEEFNEDFQHILEELQVLNSQATDIASKLAVTSKLTTTSKSTVVPIIPPEPAKRQVVLTTTPNVINGVVIDTLGNYLDGVIVVTHDKQQLPVRALKTNKLGQFIAVTPLPNGTYTLTLEKDSFIFDVYKIDLAGEVISPIIISAKKGGTGN